MNVFDVKAYGAVADGKTVCTAAIQAAIDAIAQVGGGKVCLTDGVFVSGTLFMRSGVELHIGAGATLKASADTDDFPDFPCAEWNTKRAPRASAKCLIYFGYIENASLTGMGRIDCNGSAYCSAVYDDRGTLVRYERNTLLLPARMVFIMGCTNVKVEDVTMLEMAGGWGYWVNNSSYVTFRGAKLYCNPRYPNADGIHINCSSDVLVDSCIIHSGDDSIVIRANTNTLERARPCERVVIKGCVLSTFCQAVRIAWRNDGLIRNCVLSDLVITHARVGIVIELPNHSSPTDIGENATVVENIQFSNVVLEGIEEAPVRLIVYPENQFGAIRNIRFSGITSKSGLYPEVIGREDAVLEDIYFDNCKFTVNGIQRYPTIFPAFFRNVKGLHLNNITFDVIDDKLPLNLFDGGYGNGTK